MLLNLSGGTLRSAVLAALAIGAIGGTLALAAALPIGPAQDKSPKVHQGSGTSPHDKQGVEKLPEASACKNDQDKNDDQGDKTDKAAEGKHQADKATRKAKRAADTAKDSKSGSASDENDDEQGDKTDAASKAQDDPEKAAEKAKGAAEDGNDGNGDDAKDREKCGVPAASANPGVHEPPSHEPETHGPGGPR